MADGEEDLIDETDETPIHVPKETSVIDLLHAKPRFETAQKPAGIPEMQSALNDEQSTRVYDFKRAPNTRS